MNTIRDVIRNGVLRAHETTRESELLARFGKALSTQEAIDYVLNNADYVEGAIDALGLDAPDFEKEEAKGKNVADVAEQLKLQVVDGTFYDEDDCVWSEFEGEYLLADKAVEVLVRRQITDHRRYDCDSYFCCERSGLAFDSANYTCARVDGEDVCLEYHEGDLFYWESDGEYHWEPEPEEEDNELGLSGYHDGRRGPVKPGEAVSIELEVKVGSPDGAFGDRVRAVADAAEEDGSLPAGGAEIIFGSTLLTEIEAKVGSVCSVLSDYECAGHVGDDAGFGMHINVSRQGWGIGNAVLSRILLLIGENQSFWERVAQRKEQHWAKYTVKTPGAAAKQVHSREKYEAVAIRSDDRVEFRLFRSNCRKDRILKNVEVVASVIRFCKSVFNHRDVTLPNYRAYLKANAAAYPNLTAFLSEKSI